MGVTLSLMALILFSPIMLIVAALIWIKSSARVLFRQTRPGLHSQSFTAEVIKILSEVI
jgi:lipopolysaccharide/colanic/teichoic acid biosynthesis glycosyltransferase